MAELQELHDYINEAAPVEYAKFVHDYVDKIAGKANLELDRPNIEVYGPGRVRVAVLNVPTAEVTLAGLEP